MKTAQIHIQALVKCFFKSICTIKDSSIGSNTAVETLQLKNA